MSHSPRFSDVLSTSIVPELLSRARAAITQLLARKHELSPHMSTQAIREQLELIETVRQCTSLAGQTVEGLFLSDTKNAEYLQARNNLEREATELGELLLYFGLTLKSWPVERLQHYAKELPRYSEYFIDISRHAQHALSEPEERVILLKNKSGGSVHDKLYTIITSKFMFKPVIDGKELTLTEGELRPYLLHERRDYRKAAVEAGVVPYEQFKDELGELYVALADDYDTETVNLRKYESPIAARHLGNTLPAKCYDAMVRSARKHQYIYQEFISLKQQILGLPDFQRWDFNAPVPGLPSGLPFEEAKAKVLQVFVDFAPWLHDSAKAVFDAGRVDVLPRTGKRSGAFCMPMVPGVLPLVLLNHNNTFDAISTIAHEMGHAVHETLAQEHSILVWEPPLVLAETASTFCEQLLVQDILKTADHKAKRALLVHLIDETLRSVPAQLRYTRFEEQAHALLQQGGSTQDLDKLWVQLQKEDYPMVHYPESSVQWRSIPHIFHSPFYCYSYAFGQLLVLSLWQRYQEEGAAFPPKFKAILSSGGSVPPAELLGRYGFDITSEAFWDQGFAAVERLLSQLKTLT